MGEFGNKFRKAREKKELSLDDVSNVTKIASRMLQAIEEEHFDVLPGGVFNKGFIRAYAKHLGLNDEEAVTDYLACLRQAQIDAHAVWEPQRPAPPRAAASAPKRPPVEPVKAAVKPQPVVQVEELPDLQLPRAEDIRPPRKNYSENPSREIPWGIVAVAAVVIVLAGILWIRHSHKRAQAEGATAAGNVSTAQSTPATLTTSAQVPPVAPSKTLPAASAPTSVKLSTSNTPPPATKPAPMANPAKPSIDPEGSDGSVRTVPASKPKASEKPAPALTLVIRATENSWISVQADGQTVSQETLIAPAHTSIRATREIVARVGNAAGVTFLWNGQEIPADGAEAEVKTFVFDAGGMRVVPSPPSH